MKIQVSLFALVLCAAQPLVSSAQQWIGPLSSTSNIRRTGRVGIGMATTPTQRLQVKNGNVLLDYGNFGNSGNLYFGGITDGGQAGLRLSYTQSPGFGGLIDVMSGPAPSGLIFRVDQTNGSTERMRITSDGNVGIGIAAPQFKLDVVGKSRFSDKMQIVGVVPFSSYQLSVYSPLNETAIAAWSVKGEGAYMEGWKTGLKGIAGTHIIGIAPVSSQTIGLWGLSGGGATSHSIGVHGDGIGSLYAVGVFGQGMGGSSQSYGVWGDLPAGNGYAGYFTGDVFCSTGMYLTSDPKLKKDVRPFKGALSRLSEINVYQFYFKTDVCPGMRLSDKLQYGILSDEVEKVFPEMVKSSIQAASIDTSGNITGKSLDFKAVNYEALIPVLIQAVKEQQVEIAALKEEIEALKNRGKKGKK